MAERAVKFGVDVFRQAEKTLLLQVLDQGWKDHLLMLDQMRQSIGLRAYAQKDPLNEYKKEANLVICIKWLSCGCCWSKIGTNASYFKFRFNYS